MAPLRRARSQAATVDVRDYRIVVEKVLVPALGDAPLEAITSGHVDAFRLSLVAEGRLSARTINKYLALIHGVLKRAQRVYGRWRTPRRA